MKSFFQQILIISLIFASSAFADPTISVNGVVFYKQERFKEGEISKPFYYIRHGQTNINKYGITDGNRDVPLNEEGVAQVEVAAQLLQGRNIKIIIASPAKRTKQTAEIIAKVLQVPVVYNEGLKEADWGIVVGEDLNKISENKRQWLSGVNVPGVESLLQFQTRIHVTIERIINQYDDVLIVGHSTFFANLTILLNEEYMKAKNAVPINFIPTTGNNKKQYLVTPILGKI